MTATWTDITTQDDPGSGGEAIEKGRVFRNNDDALAPAMEYGQRRVRLTGLSAFNTPSVDFTATGCIIQRFIPAYAKTITFRYLVSRFQNGGGGRVWAFVRFDDNPTHDTPISDTGFLGGGDPTPFEVVAHDISAIADGDFHKLEVYAGADNEPANGHLIRLPSGGPTITVEGGGNLIHFDFLETDAFHIVSSDHGANETTDADLTADKGHTEIVGAEWYARDEALRYRPAGLVHGELTTSAVFPTFENMNGSTPVFSLYVPKSASVLRFQVEAKITGGTSGQFFYSMADQSENDFLGSGTSSSAWEVKTVEFLNLSKQRGKVVDIHLTGSKTGGGSLEVRRPEYLSAHWKPQPITGRDLFGLGWRPWALEARQEGALLHAGWWRRMSSRDLDLQERQLLARPIDSLALVSSVGQYVQVLDSNGSERGAYKWRTYIPEGTTRLIAPIELTTAGAVGMKAKVDVPGHDSLTDNDGAVLDLTAGPGIYEPYYPIVPGDWGAMKDLAVHVVNTIGGSTWRLLDKDRSRMRII